MKFTRDAIAKLKAPTGAVYAKGERAGEPMPKVYWDDDLKGFGVLCSGITNTKSFIVQRSVKGGARKRRYTLATFAEIEAKADATNDWRPVFEELRGRASDMLNEMRKGNDPRPALAGERTLAQWRDEYLADRPKLRPRTRTTYTEALRRFEPWLDRPLRELTDDELKKAYRAIKARVAEEAAKRVYKKGRRKGQRIERPELYVSEPGAAAANTALRALRSVWKFAHGEDRERVRPWPAEQFPENALYEVGARERFVPAHDLKRLYDAVHARGADGEFAISRDMRDYVLLLLYTGMRRGEAASLRWQDVDFAAEMIRVSAFRVKSKRRFALPMSELVRDLLAARRELGLDPDRREEGLAPFVFPGEGKAGHLRDPRKAFRRIRAAAGFAVNPHSLRHTFETIAAGVPMPGPALPMLINHALPKGVTSGYLHLTAEDLRKPARDVGERIRQLIGNVG